MSRVPALPRGDAELLEAAGDAIVTLDAEGRVSGWSGAARRVFGRGPGQAVGRLWTDFFVDPDPGLLGGGERPAVVRRGGGTLRALVHAAPLVGERGGCAGSVMVVRDRTPWTGLGSPLYDDPSEAASDEALGAGFRRSMQVGDEAGPDFESTSAVAERMAIEAQRLIAGVQTQIGIVPPDRQDVFRVVAARGEWAARTVGQELARARSIGGRAMAERRVVETSRAPSVSQHGPLLREGGIKTIRSIPLYSKLPLPDGRTALGIVSFMRTQARPFTAAERRLIDDFARLAALSLLRAELRESARRTAARLQLEIEVAVDLAQSLDIQSVVQRLLRRALEATEADRCVLLRLEGDETVVEDSIDVAGLADVIGFRQPVGAQPLMARAISTRSPLLGRRFDVSGMPRVLRRALRTVRHTVTLPLIVGGEMAAVLVLSRRRDEPFGLDDLAILQLIGNVAVLALRNAWLFARAQEASRSKSDFLNMAAHELRTPLTVISGYLSMLRDGTLGKAPPAWEGPVRTLAAKVEELGGLVEDLLLAARLETGKMPAYDQEVDLVEVVRDGLRRARPQVELLEGTLEGEVPPPPVTVMGDYEHLGRVFDNLVNNALTFSGERPWARVLLEAPTGSEAGEVRLLVEDRGWGLAEAEWERIFERFYRVDDEEHGHMPGTGLGLYMSRELATRHRGRLELEWSRPGEGSRFVLTLPLAGHGPVRTPTPPSAPSTEEDGLP